MSLVSLKKVNDNEWVLGCLQFHHLLSKICCAEVGLGSALEVEEVMLPAYLKFVEMSPNFFPSRELSNKFKVYTYFISLLSPWIFLPFLLNCFLWGSWCPHVLSPRMLIWLESLLQSKTIMESVASAKSGQTVSFLSNVIL